MQSFDKSVFINCPFDGGYTALLRPLVFTMLALGFSPRLALERSDSGETRLRKIVSLIHSSKYGIHDLSRCQASEKGEFFRLNMPLELGIDIGCKLFKGGKWKSKRILILEKERFRYQAAISDMAGSDIAAHADDPEEIVKIVRDWLVQEAKAPSHPAQRIFGSYLDFMADNHVSLLAIGWKKEHIDRIKVPELQRYMSAWLKKRGKSK